MNDELQHLIADHLDGILDADGQRRLAELLAASAEARQTLARYLRLEGAAIKLGSARQLRREDGVAGTGAEPPRGEAASNLRRSPGGETTRTRTGDKSQLSLPNRTSSRRARIVWLAVAASLLAALALGSLMFQLQHIGAVGELDLLAENWLQLQESPPLDEPSPADPEPPAPSVAAAEVLSGPESDEPGFEADSIAPPSWMVAAMADLAVEKSNLD